jgi:hypothetical protein
MRAPIPAHRPAILLACCLLSAAVAAHAATLARTFKQGDAVHHRYEMKGSVAEAEFSVTGVSRGEVTEVKANGDVVITETQKDVKLTVMGADQPQPEAPPVKITRDRQGRLVELGEAPSVLTPATTRIIATLAEPLLPAQAPSDGGTWTVEFDNPARQGKKIAVKGTFTGTEKVGDVEAWKVRQTAEAETEDAQPLTSDTTFWLDPANGEIVKAEAAVKNAPSQFGLMSWTETRTRVKP